MFSILMNTGELTAACRCPNCAIRVTQGKKSVLLYYGAEIWVEKNIYSFQQLELSMIPQYLPILIYILPVLSLRIFLESIHFL